MINTPRLRLLALFALLAALAAAAAGGITLATWGAGLWRITTFGQDYIPMAPVTAMLFVLLGSALSVHLLWPESRAARLTVQGGAFLTLLVGGLVLWQAWHPIDLPWEHWFTGPTVRVGDIPVGRMSLLTGLAFLLTAAALLGQTSRWAARRSVRLVAAAAALAALSLGGVVALSYAVGTPLLYAGERIPMALLTALVFIVLDSGLVMGGLLDQVVQKWRAHDAVYLPEENLVFSRRLLLAGCALGTLIFAAGIFYLRQEQAAARGVVYGQLDAIARLKAEEITTWRNERLGEARFLMRTAAVVRDIATFVATPGDPAARARVEDWLVPIKAGDRYASITVLDARGRPLLSIPENADRAEHTSPALVTAALHGTEPVFTDLEHEGGEPALHLNLLAPIRSGTGDTPLAVIVLCLDPNTFLFPLVQDWPVPSATAETLLVRREGDEIVYLNKVRHHADAPLTMRRPVTEPLLPAALAARGEFGVHEGTDYREIPVLSAIRPIPGSPWILVAKMDQTEAFAPIQRALWQTALLVGVLLLAVVLTGTAIWRWRHAEFLRRALALEQERKILEERLGLFMRHANDSIFLLDEAGRILEANERSLGTYGYTLAELRALPPGGLRPPGAAAELDRQLRLMAAPEGAVFETVHRRKDGSVLQVEVSGRRVMIGDRPYLLGIYRDITERKRLMDDLARQEAQFRAVFDHAPVGMSLTSGGVLRLVNAEHARITGVPIEKSAEPGIFGRVSHPEDYARQMALAERFIRGEIDHYTVEKRYLHPDGHVQWAELSSRFFRGPDLGEDWIVTTVTDIQQRKEHEREIERLNRMYFVISQVNQTIVHAKTRAELFPEICRVLVEFGRFKIAWIGWLNPGTKLIDPIAVAGDEHGYVQGIKVSCDAAVPEGRGPSGTAFREGRANVCNDFFGDPALHPWHERARASGFKSSIAIPLQQDGTIRGLLTVYAPEKDFFGPQEIALLEEAAGDLSFALDVLAGNDRRLAAEAALQRSKEDFSRVFMSSPTAVCITTLAEGRLLDLNEAWERLGGYRREEVIGRTTVELQVWTESRDRDEIRRLMATEHRISGRETCFRRKDGTRLDTLLSVEGISFGGEPCLISTIIDITGQKQAQQKLTEQIEELRRWHEATLGREGRILQLKREVNELSRRLGQATPYASAAEDADKP